MRAVWVIGLALFGLACTPGGGGGGGGDGDEAPRCIAPEVACQGDWMLMRGWGLPNEDGTNWAEFIDRTWDDPTPPTEAAQLQSYRCAPHASIEDFEFWDAMAVEEFGYYASASFWPDGSVKSVRESDETGRIGFDCEMGASRAHRTTMRPTDGELVVTEYPQNLRGADGGGW